MWMPLLLVKKATYLITITLYNFNNSLTRVTKSYVRKKEILWINSSTYRPRLRKDLWSKVCLRPRSEYQYRHNLESTQKFTAYPQSTVFSKSANLLGLLQKSIICAIWKPIHIPPATSPLYWHDDKKDIIANVGYVSNKYKDIWLGQEIEEETLVAFAVSLFCFLWHMCSSKKTKGKNARSKKVDLSSL